MTKTVVKDFIVDHQHSDDLIVLGISPAKNQSNRKIRSNGSLIRLSNWMKRCHQDQWSFHNVIPEVEGSDNLMHVDSKALMEAVKDKKIIIALGTFVEAVCKKHGIKCFKIDHPSARNRNFNDLTYEEKLITKLSIF